MSRRWWKTLAVMAAGAAWLALWSRRWERAKQSQSAQPDEEGAGVGPEPEAEEAEKGLPEALSPDSPPSAVAEEAPTPEEEGAMALAATEEGISPPLAPPEPAKVPILPAAPPMSNEETAVAAREAALLYAYEVVGEQAAPDEQVEILAFGGPEVRGLAEDHVCVAVPIEVVHRAAERLPATERVVLQVHLSGGPKGWQVRSHQWVKRP